MGFSFLFLWNISPQNGSPVAMLILSLLVDTPLLNPHRRNHSQAWNTLGIVSPMLSHQIVLRLYRLLSAVLVARQSTSEKM